MTASARSSPLAVVAAVAYGFGRVAVAATSPVVRTGDSRWYELLDLSGRGRSPLPSLLYSTLPSRLAVVTAAALGVVATIALAASIAGLARHAGLRGRADWVFIGALAVAGTAHRFILWDVVVYSESLTLSLTALVIAGLLRLAVRPTVPVAVGTFAALVGSGLTRDSAAVGLVLLSPLLVWLSWPALAARFGRRAVLAALAVPIGFVLVSSYTGRSEVGTALSPEAQRLYGADSIGAFPANFAGLYLTRLRHEPALLADLRDAGMPELSPHVVPAWEADPNSALIWGEREFLDWALTSGPGTYARLLVTNPGYTLTAPLDEAAPGGPLGAVLLPTSGFAGSNLNDQTPSRRIVPAVVDAIAGFGSDTRNAGIALVVAASAGAVVVGLDRSRARVLLAPLVVALASIPLGYAVWHGSTIEHERHGIQAAFLLSVGTWTALSTSLIAVVERTRTRGPVAATPAPAGR